MSGPIVELEGIEKSFGAIRALKGIDLEVRAGEVLGLIGENGAGKSTLIKILSGVHAPDRGRIHWLGSDARFESPQAALRAGIATIHQELVGCEHLSVAENLELGSRWPRHWWGGVDWKQIHQSARAQLDRFELSIATHTRYRSLSAAEKQEIAVARALSRDARLLILDEPTASLTEREAERLAAQLRQFRALGVGILYVSHRLDEICRLTDRVAVLRDGELIARHATRSVSVEQLIRDMVGRPVEQVYARSPNPEPGTVLLEVRRAGCAGRFADVSFHLRAGEIVGLAGLIGAGRSDLARAIFGLVPLDAGEMILAGEPWRPRNAGEAIQRGLVYLPEERKRQGFVLEHSVRDSLSIGFSDQLTRWGLIRPAAEEARVAHAVRQFLVQVASPCQPVATLSGGNQQKTLLARWLERDPLVALLNEPTRGVDVGAKAEIHRLMDQLVARGKAVLLISSDLPEVLAMSDRVLVMRDGRIQAELSGQSKTLENLIRTASGAG